jgi:hypothetical protein
LVKTRNSMETDFKDSRAVTYICASGRKMRWCGVEVLTFMVMKCSICQVKPFFYSNEYKLTFRSTVSPPSSWVES